MIIKELMAKESFRKITGIFVFFAVLILLTGIHIFGSFKGMQDYSAMEAASLGREVLRGNGLNNKVIYPYHLTQTIERKGSIDITSHKNTNTAPGNAFLNAAILLPFDGGNFSKHVVKDNEYVYFLDRVIASSSVLFLAIAIGVFYILSTKMFDRKIGITIAIIMLMSTQLWHYIESCLPQMFLLMLFSLVLLTLYSAFKQHDKTNSTPWLYILIGSLLIGLMILTKWLTAWIFFGYLAALLIYFKPKGLISILSIGVISIMVIPFLYLNVQNYGSPLGAASSTIINTIATSEELILRDTNIPYFDIKGIALQTSVTIFDHISNIDRLLAGIVIAPLFFLALLHPYKRNIVNKMKWSALLMWLPVLIGTAIFGGKSIHDSHQIHILFAPIMSIIGISIISLFWARLTISRSHSYFENAHLIVIGIICGGSMITSIPKKVKTTFESKGKGKPNAPYFQTEELTKDLHDLVYNSSSSKTPVIYSDQPAATAWYADIHSISLPLKPKQLDRIDKIAAKQNIQTAGIHTSAYSNTHVYDNIENLSMMPLVNLPIASNLTYQPIPISINALNKNTHRNGESPWNYMAKQFPYTKTILRSDRNEFLDYGHHIFHSRNELAK